MLGSVTAFAQKMNKAEVKLRCSDIRKRRN